LRNTLPMQRTCRSASGCRRSSRPPRIRISRPPLPPPAPTIQAVFESIQRLSSRIEDAERRTSETIAPIAEKVAELSEQIEQTKGTGGASTVPVERAVQKIADRLDQIESGRQNGGRGESRQAPRPIAEPREPERKELFGLFRRD